MVGSTLVITLVSIVCYAILRAMADRYQNDWERLLAGEVLAASRLSPGEHQRFLDGERRRSGRVVVGLVLVGVVIGVVFGVTEDWLLGSITFGSFLLAALVAHALGSPPRSADGEEGREVRIGSRGVQVLGRYVPFRAPGARIGSTELTPGNPAVLIVHVGNDNRLADIRVPVPRDRVGFGDAMADRLFHEASGRGIGGVGSQRPSVDA